MPPSVYHNGASSVRVVCSHTVSRGDAEVPGMVGASLAAPGCIPSPASLHAGQRMQASVGASPACNLLGYGLFPVNACRPKNAGIGWRVTGVQSSWLWGGSHTPCRAEAPRHGGVEAWRGVPRPGTIPPPASLHAGQRMQESIEITPACNLLGYGEVPAPYRAETLRHRENCS